MIEQRRSNWTTFSNLNLWFNTWKKVLVELGFGRKKITNEECEASIVFLKLKKVE